MQRGSRLLALASGALAVLGYARPVAAQEAVAEQLFIEAKALMARSEFEKACAKFKASHDLDHTATGTLLNLALCHERIGKAASAWAEFRQVAAESAGRREDRVTMAREHEAKLQPLLEYITLVVPPSARVRGLTIVLDHDSTIPIAGWDTPVPIDAGSHVIQAAAPNKTTSTQAFTVGGGGAAQRVVIKPLADLPPVVVPPDVAPDRTRRTVGLVLGGVGIVTAGIGIGIGLEAAGKNRKALRSCPNDVCVDEPTRAQASDELSSAHAGATAANVLVGAGALAVAGGVVLVLTAPRGTKASLAAAPFISAQGAGLGLGGAW